MLWALGKDKSELGQLRQGGGAEQCHQQESAVHPPLAEPKPDGTDAGQRQQ
jgi:hypothetical protein